MTRSSMAFMVGVWLLGVSTARCVEPLTGAEFGPATNYASFGNGDVWTNTWADDGELYSTVDDSSFAGNLGVMRLVGNDPRKLKLEVVNRMAEYGQGGQLFGPERRCWKGNSILCVDGVLYLSLSRHDYPWAHKPQPADQKQLSLDGSIVKSLDHGKTWTRTAKENMAHPMFPGPKFATGFFIQYGRNTSVAAHGSDRFVYALSNDGYWNNGNTLILGRVARDKLGDLNGKDWRFYTGGDGQQDAAWSGDVNRAKLLLNEPDKIGMCAAAYIPQRQRYVLFQWHYEKNHFGGPTTWVLRESPTPWGPWTPFASTKWAAERYYNPCVISKFIADDGLNLWVATNGEWTEVPKMYSLKTIPVRLSTVHASNK